MGDYRRVALYGIDFLISEKEEDKRNCGCGVMSDEVIRLREEISMQIKALKEMKQMAMLYGYDISQPAANAREAVQWLYFGYLAAIKTQNGAAMSVGRIVISPQPILAPHNCCSLIRYLLYFLIQICIPVLRMLIENRSQNQSTDNRQKQYHTRCPTSGFA